MATTTLRLGYSGQYRDPVIAAYPLGNGYRIYLPGLMRFNAPDNLSPFGLGGVNPYAYCLDDPINRSDPSGHVAFELESFTNISKQGIRTSVEELGDAPIATLDAQDAAASPARFHDTVHFLEFNKEENHFVGEGETPLEDKSTAGMLKKIGRNYFPPMSAEEVASHDRPLTPVETLIRAETDVKAVETKISVFGKSPGYEDTDLPRGLAEWSWGKQKRKIEKVLGELQDVFSDLRTTLGHDNASTAPDPLVDQLRHLEDRTRKVKSAFDALIPPTPVSTFTLKPLKRPPRLLKS